MSLGAIDFGLVVDGSVVMIENIVRRLGHARSQGVSREEVIAEAGREVARPIFFAVLIIIIVYLPILTLQGIEGKMFGPMAVTVVFALVGSLMLALTLMPVLAALFFRKPSLEHEPRIVRRLNAWYKPALEWTIARPGLTAAIAAAVFVVSVALVPFMGTEFIPKLDEGAIAIQAWRLPSVALTESVRSTTLIERTLRQFPEVVTVVSRTGQAEIPTDPMGVETSDIFVILKDHGEWTTANTREGLVAKINDALEAAVPGNVFSYSQPIELRVQELIAGVRSDLAITLYGDNLDELRRVGGQIVNAVSRAGRRGRESWNRPEDFLARAHQANEIARTHQRIAVLTSSRRWVGRSWEYRRAAPVRAAGGLAVLRVGCRYPQPEGRGLERRMIPLSQSPRRRRRGRPRSAARTSIARSTWKRMCAAVTWEASWPTSSAPSGRVSPCRPAYLEYGGQFENLERASARLGLVVPSRWS